MPASAAVTLLHKFAGGANDGSSPSASVTLQGSTLYGVTETGGDSDRGTVFKINTNGTGYQILHEFAGGANDGDGPVAGLSIVGSTLYGTTGQGGDADKGTIFRINTNGTGFQLMHEFVGGASDSAEPRANLLLQGSTLYGTTAGGESGKGSVFRINTDGTGYQQMHAFLGSPTDGRSPYGGLTLDGSILYGTTLSGGGGAGTIFKIGTNGADYQRVHTFTSGPNSGDYASGDLVLNGGVLYGTTGFGGDANDGTVYKVSTNGSGFQLLHEFGTPAGDGDLPTAGMALVGSTFYGTTAYGGASGNGSIYKINADGAGYQRLHDFTGGANDGAMASAGLIYSGSTLYGTTTAGGDGGLGTIFAMSLAAPGTPGDYNGNGLVGIEDYNVWKGNFGSTTQLAADGNGNNVVDAADYTFWRNRFGQGAASVDGAAAIPEPHPRILLIFAVVVSSTIRYRFGSL